MKNDQNPPPPELLSTLYADLAATLHAPGGPDTLLRQTQALDAMLYPILGRAVAGMDSHYCTDRTQKWLSLALQIQKQCRETVKTAGAIDYMNMLMSRAAPSPATPPALAPFTAMPYNEWLAKYGDQCGPHPLPNSGDQTDSEP